jgi:hypothetical protein
VKSKNLPGGLPGPQQRAAVYRGYLRAIEKAAGGAGLLQAFRAEPESRQPAVENSIGIVNIAMPDQIDGRGRRHVKSSIDAD